MGAVVFVSKFMSCVICLNIAREIFLLQSNCSAMTKVHNFSLLGLTCFVKDKQMLKTEDTKEIGYYPSQTNLWSFSTEMSFFTEDF